jgi:hypothetical protein
MCPLSSFARCHSEVRLLGSPPPSHRRCNSLPVKIVRVSSLQSRFWRPIRPLGIGNLNKTQRLSDMISGVNSHQYAANSLCCNILHVTSLELIFCSPNSRYLRAKWFVIRILSHQDKKRVRLISLIPLSSLSIANFAREVGTLTLDLPPALTLRVSDFTNSLSFRRASEARQEESAVLFPLC